MSKAVEIETAGIAGIVALAISGAPTPVARKTPTLPNGTQPPGIVMVSGEETAEHLFGAVWMVSYPLSIVIITAGGNLHADNPTLRTWREDIRNKMFAPATFSGVSGFNNVLMRGSPVYNKTALDANLNYSPINITVEVEETRP